MRGPSAVWGQAHGPDTHFVTSIRAVDIVWEGSSPFYTFKPLIISRTPHLEELRKATLCRVRINWLRAFCPKLTPLHWAQESDQRQPKYLHALEAAFIPDEDESAVLPGGSFTLW